MNESNSFKDNDTDKKDDMNSKYFDNFYCNIEAKWLEVIRYSALNELSSKHNDVLNDNTKS